MNKRKQKPGTSYPSASVIQLEESQPFKLEVAGSTPARGTDDVERGVVVLIEGVWRGEEMRS